MTAKLDTLRKVVKVTDPLSPQKTAQNIIKDLRQSSPNFSYAPTRKIEQAIFSGEMSEAQVRHACSRGTKQSVKCNTDASLKLFETSKLLRDTPVLCHPLKKGIIYPYTQDRGLLLKPTFFYVKDGQVIVPWTQYNKRDRYTEYHFALVTTILKQGFSEHFDDPEILSIDLSARDKSDVRETRFFFSSELTILSDGQLESFFAVYAEAVKIVEGMGYTVNGPADRNRRTDDNDQGNLF